jgi:PAS domain S-box-containing protein
MIMKPEAPAADPAVLAAKNLSRRAASRPSSQAEPCPAAHDDESAAKYLFQLSHDVILFLDRIGNILCINQRGVQLSGYSETELRGANIFERLLLPEERQVAREMLGDVLEGKAREYEIRWRTKDGTIVHFDGASVPRLSDSGEFLSTLCTLRDVTERKRAEEELRKSQEKYRDLIEISPDAIYVVDANGVCVLGNRAGAELAGIPQSKLVGTPVTDTYVPEERHLFLERLEKLRTGGTLRFERKFVRKNGEIVPVEVSVTGVRGGYFQAILRDISKRKHAEKALRESEERYRVLVEFSPISICVHRDGKVLYMNEAGVRLFGAKDLTEVIGRSVLDFIHPDSLTVVRERMRQVQAGQTAPPIEERFITLNGEVRDVEVTAIPIVYEHAPATQVIIRDITERKQGEALLAGEKRLLEMIATGVALKEILNALCLIIEEFRSGTLASVLLLNPDGLHLDSAAGPSLPKGWTQQMEKLPIGPCAGSCGTAAFRASPVIVSDIATDPLWDVPEHRASALKHGLRASWSNPVLSSEGTVLGTFCMYYRETRSPNAQDLELIELATHIVRVAIERDRAGEALRASEQVARGQVEALTYSLDVLATAPAPEKFIGQMLSTIGRLLNAQSVSLWLFDESTDSLVWRLMADGGKLTEPDPEHPFMKDPLLWKQNHAIQELLFTAGPVVCEDVETDPRVTGEWRDYLKRKGAKRFLAVPILVGGQVRGFVGIRHSDRASYRPEEIELTQALAHQVMLAIQLNEFAEQSQRAAVFEERNRMARDIHDTLAQGFTGVIVQLEAAEDAVSCGCRREADDHLHRAGELARRSLSEARRSVHALRPQALQEHNFWDALKGIIKNTTVGTALRTKFEVQGKLPELPRPWQENLLRIGQEALTNTLKYAHAHNFKTRLTYKAKELCLEFRDDGDGFKVKDRHDGVGLAGMRERVAQMGGELKITSARGKGTKITVVLPCNGESMS